MDKPKLKPRGRPFQKGNQAAKGNEIAPAIIEGRKVTKMMFEGVLHKFLNATRDDIERYLADKNTPALELMVLGILSKAAKNGDPYRAEFLLNRLLGKVPDRIIDESPTRDIKSMAQKLLDIVKDES